MKKSRTSHLLLIGQIYRLDKEMLLSCCNKLSQKHYSIQDIEDEGEENLWIMIVNNMRVEVFDALLRRFGDIVIFFESLVEIHPCDNDIALSAFAWFDEKMPPIDNDYAF